jgi:SM-20-related protein
MPSLQFFQKLGFFALGDFLDVKSCAEICSEMRRASQAAGEIIGALWAYAGEGVVNEDVRRVSLAAVKGPAASLVRSSIDDLRPRLEEHFGTTLVDRQGPQFLRYRPGAFYRAHRDASPSTPEHIASRCVSIVIFLNSASEHPAEGTYGGGLLRFYGALRGPQWENCALPIEAPVGALIAFRPDILHEVLPVTFGERMTIAAWFTGHAGGRV